MTTLTHPRRSPAQRFGWAVVPALSCAVGVVVGARLSGYEVDMELVGIVALGALGVWLLITAAVAGVRDRQTPPVYAQTPAEFAAVDGPDGAHYTGPDSTIATDSTPDAGAR
mgnify:CR=1 FL=1